MRGLSRTARHAIRHLGYFLALCTLPTLLLGADPAIAPVMQPEAVQSVDDKPTAVTELLSLIEQLDPLRVTVPYIDYHDEAVAAQTRPPSKKPTSR